MYVCGCNAYRGQKRALDLMELESLTVVSCMWVLGIESGSLDEQQVL